MESNGSHTKVRPDDLDRIEAMLNTIIRAGRFDLRVGVTEAPADVREPDGPEWVVNLSGRDADLVLESHAALLEALASVASKAARLDENLTRRIAFDCEGYRSARAGELRLMAEMAAEQVRATHRPFALSAMSSAERRVIHLALRDSPEVRTESQGMGPERKVVIHPT